MCKFSSSKDLDLIKVTETLRSLYKQACQSQQDDNQVNNEYWGRSASNTASNHLCQLNKRDEAITESQENFEQKVQKISLHLEVLVKEGTNRDELAPRLRDENEQMSLFSSPQSGIKIPQDIEPYWECVKQREEVLGLNNPLTLQAVQLLASTYQESGHYERAVQLWKRAALGWELELGPCDPYTICAERELCDSHQLRGNYNEAINITLRILDAYNRSIEINRNGSSPTTDDGIEREVLNLKSQLAFLYDSVGCSKEAESLHIHVLKVRSHILGADHDNTLDALERFSLNQRLQGHLQKAVGMYSTIYERRAKILGERCLDALRALGSLQEVQDELSLEIEADIAEQRRQQRRWWFRLWDKGATAFLDIDWRMFNSQQVRPKDSFRVRRIRSRSSSSRSSRSSISEMKGQEEVRVPKCRKSSFSPRRS